LTKLLKTNDHLHFPISLLMKVCKSGEVKDIDNFLHQRVDIFLRHRRDINLNDFFGALKVGNVHGGFADRERVARGSNPRKGFFKEECRGFRLQRILPHRHRMKSGLRRPRIQEERRSGCGKWRRFPCAKSSTGTDSPQDLFCSFLKKNLSAFLLFA